METVSFVASIISVVLAVVAIWLSLQFYKMSENTAKEIREINATINTNVGLLQELFKTFHSETFALLQRLIITEDGDGEETQHIKEKKLEKVKKSLADELQEKSRDGKGPTVRKKDANEIIKKAFEASQQAEIEARREALRERILSVLVDGVRVNTPVKGNRLVGLGHISPLKLLQELKQMREEGIVEWDGEELLADTVVNLAKNQLPKNVG